MTKIHKNTFYFTLSILFKYKKNQIRVGNCQLFAQEEKGMPVQSGPAGKIEPYRRV